MSAPAEIHSEWRRLAGIETFLLCTRGEGPATVFVHGNPTSSADWLPFLRSLQAPALALDLPGFGRSERPDPRRLDYSMGAYADFMESAIGELGVGEHSLVVHDWGAIALAAALRRPERLRRLVVINAVPLLPGYRWHWLGRLWRRRGLGELFMRATTRAGVALLLRQARPRLQPMPDDFVAMIWDAWDRGTARAILRLYRSADPAALEAAGAGLGRLGCPALVVWGLDDPYIPSRFGRAYAERLPAAELVELEQAGHWPWIDRPELVDRVCSFLTDPGAGQPGGR